MESAFLRLYSNTDLARMFQRETGSHVRGQFVRAFRSWVEKKAVIDDGVRLPYDFHLWLLQRLHEYSRLNQ